MTTPRILAISFSPLARDARVLRQLEVLRERGEVTTVGYGPAPAGVARHIEVPARAASLPQTVHGVAALAARRYARAEGMAPGEIAAQEALAGTGPWDLVVANDARALPLAFRHAQGAPVWADLHEWAPEENSSDRVWRLLVGPYMDALCARYLPRAAAVSTVGASIAALYAEHYGVAARVVRNALPDQGLAPVPLGDGPLRLVHSGVAAKERNIEALIDAAQSLGSAVTLDLYLVPSDESYLETLRRRAARSHATQVRAPVPSHALPATLNGYDLGVYLLPVTSHNHRLMLPNKFFDYVQARIGVVFPSSRETDALIDQYGLGVIVSEPTPQALVDALAALTPSDVWRFKTNAHAAASALSNDTDLATQREIVQVLLGDRP